MQHKFSSFSKQIAKEKIKCVMIYANNECIFEYYKNNKQRDKGHKINSCTKSVLSILIGIAIDHGYIKDVHTPIQTFFPELIEKQEDKRKEDITIYHLLTMTAGFDFPEFGEWNSFAPMVYHHDIVKFVVDRPLEYEPGVKMNYNSGCSHILSAILQQATGMTVLEFAEKYLFRPLGITNLIWHRDKKGIFKGADGLVLQAADMIKIGQLMLQEGVYNKKQIVASSWIKESLQPHFLTYGNIGYYGFHWWVNTMDAREGFTEENTYYFALGFGGQYIVIVPSKQMVISVTSEMYEASLKPMQLLKEFVLV